MILISFAAPLFESSFASSNIGGIPIPPPIRNTFLSAALSIGKPFPRTPRISVVSPSLYAEIVAEEEAEKEAAEQAELEAAATPTNAEIAQALMELADNVNTLMDAVTELAGEVAALKGGE